MISLASRQFGLAEGMQGMAEATVRQRQKRALTARSIVLGAVGSAILTASSLFIALRMGMLPWPIAFAAIVSVLFLRVLGSHNLHEANVTHAAMSAGSMVAGGVAFTVPALWILGLGEDLSVSQVLFATLGGTVLGLIACAALQPYFIREKRLAFPIGTSAADTIRAVGDTAAADAPALFGGMGFAAAYAALRDVAGLFPQILFAITAIPGIASFGIYNSPMTIAVGFMVGVVPALVWFLGALIGHFGIAFGLPALGLVGLSEAADMRVSLGLGLMLGCGAGMIVASMRAAHARERKANRPAEDERSRRISCPRAVIGIVSAAVACFLSLALGWGLLAGVLVTLCAWFCVYLAAWLVGTTGIDPMEIFGILVLILVQVLFRQISTTSLFLVATVVAVACGVGGDVMNDLKAGDSLETDPRDQFWGMVVGSVVGAVVASFLIIGMHEVYGSQAFGPNGLFVSVQATNVAAMAGGIPHIPAFVVGLVAGCAMALAGLPVMTLGLGVYLPFYLSSGAVLGAAVSLFLKRRHKADAAAAVAAKEARTQAVASGILGGESLVGVLIALVALAMTLAA
jgi:uncharacterized oligopeptide transporter (OPT) family protein